MRMPAEMLGKWGTLLAGIAWLIAAPSSASAHGETLIRIAALTREIEAATNNAAQLLVSRAELHRTHEDWTAAEADYARAARINPELVAIDISRAEMLFESGDLKAAHALFDQVVHRHPDNGRARFGRARVLLKKERREEAIADFKRALKELAQPEPEHFLECAEALKVEGKREEALLTLDRGIRKFGPIVPLQEYAVKIDLELRNYSSAVTRLDSIIDLMARKEAWLAQRGEVFLLAGRAEEARKSFKAALKAMDLLPKQLQQGEAMRALLLRVRTSLASISVAQQNRSDSTQ